MSKTVYHQASRQWLSAVYAKQLDDALAAARQVGRFGRPHASGSSVLRTPPNSLITDEPWNFITGKSAGALERLDRKGVRPFRGDTFWRGPIHRGVAPG